MKQYKVSFLLTVDDDSSHPRKWIPDALWDSLRTDCGEDINNYVFEEVGYVPNTVAKDAAPVV